jgi:hypothetical protein
MAQFARPDQDTTIGNFQDNGGGTTNIFGTIDEASPSDSDFIRSPTSPSSEVYVCRLSDVVDPVSSSGHTMRMRTSTDLDNQEVLDFTQQLRQGYTNEGAQGTLIASQSRNGVSSTSWTTSTHNLSGAEADAITDYTALFFRFIVNRP